MININLSKFSKVPLYEQIIKEIKRNIISGEIKEKERLPSIRQLAKDLEVSVITVKKAYENLEQEKFLMSIPSQGTYVADLDIDLIERKILAEIDAGIEQVIIKAKSIGLSSEEIVQRFSEKVEE